jgi:ABC-type uncharacterized transport system substrate-binding protein
MLGGCGPLGGAIGVRSRVEKPGPRLNGFGGGGTLSGARAAREVMGMGARVLRLLPGLAAIAVWLGLCAPANAHPHVWVTVETTLLYERGGFTGFKHKWTFDEFYSAMAVEGLDTNNDGKYSREELAELAKVNVTSLKDFSYFTFPQLAGQAVKLGEPRDYWLEHKDGILTLYFVLPFATPVLPEAKRLTFGVYDPSFFIAFELAKGANPIRLSEGAPKGCQIKVGVPERDPGDASALGEQLSAIPGFGVSVSKVASVECKGP